MSDARQTPYQGLVPYSEADAAFFFGREREQEIIITNLKISRLTLLYGSSGVGKSSVLRAGVVHRLRKAGERNFARRGTPLWAIAAFSAWRDEPIFGVERAVADAVATAIEGRAFEPVPPSRDFVENLRAWSKLVGGNLLIILDQFEEYFLYHPHSDGEGTFGAELARVVNQSDLGVNVLISIREDALAQLDRFKGRIPNLFDNYFRLEHLNPDAARASIEKPVEQYNRLHASEGAPVTIESALIEEVLDEVAEGKVVVGETGRGVVAGGGSQEQIETPFLQLVMTRLWEEEMRSGSRALRLATLHRLGGAEKIVRSHLDAVMGRLPASEQQMAAKVFHYLVTPSGTKIAQKVSDLANYAETSREQIGGVIDKLSSRDDRILRPVPAPLDEPGEPRCEIFHDVLAPAILDWRRRFVDLQERELERLQEQQRLEKARLEEHERRVKQRLWAALIAGGTLLGVFGTLAAITYRQRNAAQAAGKLASAREMAFGAMANLDQDPERSVLLALCSFGKAYTPEGQDALRQALSASQVRTTLLGHKEGLFSAAFSPDGLRVVTGSEDQTAKVWDAGSGRLLLTLEGHGRQVRTANFSPDGSRIVTASHDKTARIWDAATGQPIGPDLKHQHYVSSAVFSPDGTQILTSSRDGTAVIWDAETREKRVTVRAPDAATPGTPDWVRGASFSPDGTKFATAHADGCGRVWDAATGTLLNKLSGHKDWVWSIAFSPDGTKILTASQDQTARLWDAATGAPVQIFRGHSAMVVSAAFCGNDRVLTASLDQTAKLWSVSTGRELATLQGHTDWLRSVACAPDGLHFATASRDGTARIWEAPPGHEGTIIRGLENLLNAAFSPDGKKIATVGRQDKAPRVWDAVTGRELFALAGHTSPVVGVSFSSDGKTIATASRDQTARTWNAETGQAMQTFTGHAAEVFTARFSPDGQRLVTASFDKTARVWDIASGRELKTFSGHAAEVSVAVFNADGSQVLTGSFDDTGGIWDVATGERTQVLEVPPGQHHDQVWSAAFSPDGKLAAMASFNAVRIWDVRSGTPRHLLKGHRGTIASIEFSPDGKQILSGGDDETARVWDVATGRETMVLRNHREGVVSVAFSHDGRSIMIGDASGITRIYNTGVDELMQLASTRVTRNLTPEEREKYLHESPKD